MALRVGRIDSVGVQYLPRYGLAQDYLISMLFAINLTGVAAIGPVFAALPDRISKAIHWIAGATFTLYLLHQPIMTLIVAVLPWSVSSHASQLVVLVGTMAGVFLVAQFTERRKDVWRALFTGLLPKMAHP